MHPDISQIAGYGSAVNGSNWYIGPKFLDFCIANQKRIQWANGNPPHSVLFEEKRALERHRITITNILGRRNKFYAHLDKEYFEEPERVYEDFPIEPGDFIALFQCIEQILAEHQKGLDPKTAKGTLAGWFEILVDNMLRRLALGKKQDR